MTDVVQEVLRLSEELEQKKRAAIQELLRRRREVVKDIDAKLASLGYREGESVASTASEPSRPRKRRGPMSDEHKRKIAETRARNKAAKQTAPAEPEKPPRLIKRGGEG
jgi:hypothetical protein